MSERDPEENGELSVRPRAHHDPKAQDVRVTVILKPDEDPPFEFRSPIWKNGKLRFKNDHFPGFNVYFELDPQTRDGYRFPSDETLALSAIKLTPASTRCPKQGRHWSEFEPVEVTNNNTVLEVRNLNNNDEEFGFSLFVTKDNGVSYLQLDPIGDNQDGSRS